MDENDADVPKVVLTSGALLEIEAFHEKKNLEWKNLSRIALILSNVCEKNVRKASSTIAKIVDNDNEETEKLLAKISEVENKLSFLCLMLSEETTAKLELQHEVKTLSKEYEVVSGQPEKKFENLAKLTPGDVTKRVNRQKENNKVLQEQVTAATNKISDLENENDELNKSLDSALRTTLALRKSVSNLKIKNRKANEKNNSHSYNQSLKQQILFWKMRSVN